jgi:hypothetical protein
MTASGGIYGRPRKPKAQAHDLIVRFVCPCGCKRESFIPIVLDSVQAFERNEFGILKKDGEGNLIPKIRITHEYQLVASIHPAWTPDMNEEYKVLYDRAQAEKEYAEKHQVRKRSEKLLAEQAA